MALHFRMLLVFYSLPFARRTWTSQRRHGAFRPSAWVYFSQCTWANVTGATAPVSRASPHLLLWRRESRIPSRRATAAPSLSPPLATRKPSCCVRAPTPLRLPGGSLYSLPLRTPKRTARLEVPQRETSATLVVLSVPSTNLASRNFRTLCVRVSWGGLLESSLQGRHCWVMSP